MAHARLATTVFFAFLLTISILLAGLPLSTVAVAGEAKGTVSRAKAALNPDIRVGSRADAQSERKEQNITLPVPSSNEGLPVEPAPHRLLEAQFTAAEPKPLMPSPGDWIVTGEEIHENEVIILTGNLIVQAGGNLTLINCTLYMNCTYDGQWQILVNSSGVFSILEGSTITAYNPEYEFLFYVYGSLTMRDSFLSECGYDWNCPGLWLKTDEGVIIENCTITNCFYGVYCLKSSGITITGCTISQNDGCGVYCRYSSNITITNCEISSLRLGIVCRCSFNATITNCQVSQSELDGIYCRASSDITIMNCTISHNGRFGIACWYSTGIHITGCSFIRDGVLIDGNQTCHFTSHRIEGNTVNGRPLYYIVNIRSPYEVSSDAGQVIIVNSTQIKLTDLNLSYTDVGLEIAYSEDMQVENCIMNENHWSGVLCYKSSNIIITSCQISQNEVCGIGWGDRSSNITIIGCTISRNDGCGVWCGYGSANITIISCTMSMNEEDGIICFGSTNISIMNCEISYNNHNGIDYAEYLLGINVVNCRISHNNYNGIYCRLSSDISIMNCEVSHNNYIGICCTCSSNVSVHFCDIFSNGEHGLFVDGTYVVNATYNWWGSPDGPEYKEDGDPEDPEEVYSWDGPEYVLYEPWLTEPAVIDLVPPRISIEAPSEGSYVRGTVLIRVNATDNVSVDHVEFYINSTLAYTDYEAPYEYEWDTTAWPDGAYVVEAVAYDTSNNTAHDTIMVIVDNTAPVISSVEHSPEESSEGQEVTVTANVSDATSGVDRVILFYRVGGGEWTSVEMTEQDGAWTAVIPGQEAGVTVEFKIVAYDKAGNTAESSIYSYTVKKAAPTAPAAPTTGVIIGVGAAIAALVAVGVAMFLRKRITS